MRNSPPLQDNGDSETLDALFPWILRSGVAACFLGHGMLTVTHTAAGIAAVPVT